MGGIGRASLSGVLQSGPQIDTTTPTLTGVVDSPASGELGVGKTVTLTLDLSDVGDRFGRNADADAERRRRGDLFERFGHQRPDLHLYGGGVEHGRRRAGGDERELERREDRQRGRD